jgi:long-chain acyl-CoA synthetase
MFTVFALSHIGASAVPINFLLKPEELNYICSDVHAGAIVTQSAFLETVNAVRKTVAGLKRVWVTDLKGGMTDGSVKPYSSLLEGAPPIADFSCGDEQTILILYTSGTTGKSKGAMLSHRNLVSNALASIEALSLRSRDRFICILPMFHVFAWTTNVLVPLRMGCPIVLVESIRPPKPWLKLMFKYKVTCFIAVPQIYAVLADQARGFKKWILRFIFFRYARICISGAAPLLMTTLEKFEKNFGVPLLEGYGLTETSPVSNANTLTQRKRGSVGKCIPGVRVKIIDADERDLPEGQEGEICISGPNIMQGYYNQPEATKNAFTRDGWFKTGDVGRIDEEGFLFIEDRIKDMIIVKGLKVFSIQVEEILLGHPAVAEAAVVGIPNPSGDETIKGFVALKEGQTADKSELLRLCQEKLPPYKRPKDIEILTELPKNALQKVLKRELRLRSQINARQG